MSNTKTKTILSMALLDKINLTQKNSSAISNGIKINVLKKSEVNSPFYKSKYAYNPVYKYYVKLSYNGNSSNFTYYESIYNFQKNVPLNKKDVLYCLLSDMNCFEYTQNLQNFLDEFGYDDNIKQGIKAYKGCKLNSEKLHKIFSSDELEQLQDEFQEY